MSVSDSGDCGKSYLFKTIFHAVCKVFIHRSAYLTKPWDYSLIIDVININIYTIHTGLHISCRGNLLLLNDANEVELRSEY